MKVFIADELAVVRERLIDMLSELPGIEIIGPAQGAQEAINSIQKPNPDAVILNIHMLGGNGIELLKNINKNESVPLVIILTNYSYPEYRKKCMDLGTDFFFDKSTEFEKVTGVIKELIQSSHKR